MGKLHFIKPAQQKRLRVKMRWRLACLILTGLIIAENLYLLYIFMR